MKRRTVLITRPREQSEDLRRDLEADGFEVFFFPTIKIEPPASWEACDRALDRPPAYYNAIIFASANGVKNFMQRVRDRGLDLSRFSRCTIYAVGSKTAEEVERGGLTVEFVPEQFNARALARHLTASDIRGQRFLLPRGNLGRDELLQALGDAGAEVEAVEVYRTVAADMAGVTSLVRKIFQGDIDVITFASPSAAKNFAGALPGGRLAEVDSHTTIVAIGPSTLEMLRTLGATGAIAAEVSTARGLADAITQHFGRLT
jgi:uroporphyrinogen III methyltransferase / synthase